jgi:hypothetical protein
MRRLSTKPPFTCVTCEATIPGSPVIHLGLPFCCAGCVAGGPCICSYDDEATDDERAGHHDDNHVQPEYATRRYSRDGREAQPEPAPVRAAVGQALADDVRGVAAARR